MASTARKVLRVGVVRGGHIVEERHLAGEGPVTIGRGAKNTIVLSSPDAPVSLPLFAGRPDGVHLLFSDALTGTVALDGPPTSLEELRDQGRAPKVGELHALKLPEVARGAVEVGESTVFFQFVALPSHRAPVLPKGSWYRHLDRVFLGVLAGSLAAHLIVGAWVYSRPRPPEPEIALEEIADRFVRLQEIPKPPEPPKVDAPEEETVDGTKTADRSEQRDATESATPATPRKALEQKVAAKGLLKVLGGMGASQGGQAFSDVIGAGGGLADLDGQLQQAQVLGVAARDGLDNARGGERGEISGIGQLGTQGGGKVELGPKKEVQVAARVDDLEPEIESSEVDRDEVAQYVKARLRSIQNCYEKELKRTPQLRGKVAVRFSITPTGRTSDVTIVQNTVQSDAVAACVRTVIRGWTFAFRPPESVEVSYPFVFSASGG